MTTVVIPTSSPSTVYIPVKTPVRCYACISNPTSNNSNPFAKYQALKQIQNTVGVDSSQYTFNLIPTATHPGQPVWKNTSDRAVPHKQFKANTAILSSYRPGAFSPGGVGCDVKHNSYVRYLNRIKGKVALRRDRIPETFLLPTIPFTCAQPIYGDKQVKTSIVGCPPCGGIQTPDMDQLQNIPQNPYYAPYIFVNGQTVAILNPLTRRMVRGVVDAYFPATDMYTVTTVAPVITLQVSPINMFLVKC